MELTVAMVYALLAGLGLVTIDSVVSAHSVYLDAKAAYTLEEKGYSKEVIDQIFLTRFKEISATKSLIEGVTLASSKTKPVSVALAELVNLEDSLIAIQTMLGVVQSKVILSTVVDADERKRKAGAGGSPGPAAQGESDRKADYQLLLTGFSKQSGYFVIKIANDRESPMDLDELIREGAYQIVLKLNPYIAALHKLDTAISAGGSLDPAKAMIEGLIGALPDTPTSPDRARLENLLGLIALLQEDVELAEIYFRQSMASDPDFHVAKLNMAFVDLHYDRHDQAIAKVESIAEPWYWPATGNELLLAAAHVIRGVALSRLGRKAEAVRAFRYATSINPRSSEAYFYWSHLANYTSGIEEAQALLQKSKQNSTNFENYAEVAMFYFWLSDANNMPLVRRGRYGFQ
ncbi:MAG: tetratricopeptide repeat protein [Alphaproteobacteria bacterium]